MKLEELTVRDLSSLVLLSATNNRLARLPRSVGRLTRLEELSVYCNNLVELPEEICEYVSLCNSDSLFHFSCVVPPSLALPLSVCSQ